MQNLATKNLNANQLGSFSAGNGSGARPRWPLIVLLLGMLSNAFGGGSPLMAQSLAAEPAKKAGVLVVCPQNFRTALQPWIEYRQRQGFDVHVIDSQPTAPKLRDAIRTAARDNDRTLLLIGDCPTIGSSADPNRQVPVAYIPTLVTAKFGSTPTMGTDYPYGDVDNDQRTDLAVGRMPVDTPEQLTAIIGRIKAYESANDFSTWRGRLQLVGGVGGFGFLADKTIESVTRMIVTASLPPEVRTSVAYGSPGHLFYPNERFSQAVINRYGEGCRFWVYAGHGMVDSLDNVPAGPTGAPVLDNTTIQNLECDPTKAPIAILLCCYTGAIDARIDSFAERLYLHDCGPIAVIAGSRVTMPYGNTSLTLGLVESIFGTQHRIQKGGQESAESTPQPIPGPQTPVAPEADFKPSPVPLPAATRLGQAWLHAINQLEEVDDPEKTQLQVMVDAIATLVSPSGSKLQEERREHAALYSLLGDPLLKLQPPAKIDVQCGSGVDFGETVKVTIQCPIDGQCVVTLDKPLGHSPKSKPGQPYIDPNQLTFAKVEKTIQGGQKVDFEIPVSGQHEGYITIRVHVTGKDAWATGSSVTNLRPPAKGN